MAKTYKLPLLGLALLAIAWAPLLRGAMSTESLRAEIEANWWQPAGLCRIGEALYRLADFPGAAIAYRGALDANPNSARAWLGLGRLEQIRFRRRSARDLIAKAFRLDPRDPEVVLAYSEYAADPHTRAVLLQNVAALARSSNPAQAEAALAQLQMEQRLGGRSGLTLASPYRRYSQELTPFRAPGAAAQGMLIAVRLNGGPPLRLVLDTGATGIAIGRDVTSSLDLEVLGSSRLGGVASGAVEGRTALARTASVGDLLLRDCLVRISDKPLVSGADGVAGMDLFERFQIVVDAKERRLELNPFPEPPPSDSARPWLTYERARSDRGVSLYGLRHLLLVKARINRRGEGLFLVDTGAAFTSIAEDQAGTGISSIPELILGPCGSPMRGRRAPPLQLDFDGHTVTDAAPIALDLRHMSEQEGVRISGVLGYPALAKMSMTISYRDGWLDLHPSRQ